MKKKGITGYSAVWLAQSLWERRVVGSNPTAPIKLMTSKDKMSKKQRREENRRKRTMWDFNPVTRVVPSKKKYSRKGKKTKNEEEEI